MNSHAAHTPLDLSENYRLAWADYRRLRKLSLSIGLLGLPLIWLLTLPAMHLPKIQVILGGVLGVIWVLLLFRYSVAFQQWSCPRCGENFQKFRWGNRSYLASGCGTCGLKKFEIPQLDHQDWRPSL
jgi:hypothetical protein